MAGTNKFRGKYRSLRKQAGFTMMEMLVAVLVMGVGVLGVTGLQLVSLQNNQAALMRAEAVQFAYDILDRIRVNPGATTTPGEAYDGVALNDDPPNAANCLDNTCTAAQMRNFDIALWKCSLGSFNGEQICEDIRGWDALPPEAEQPGLPNGDGSIVVNTATNVITVTIQWDGFNKVQQTIAISSQG